MFNNITDVPGVSAGHASDRKGLTGCTAVIFKGGAVGSMDVRGPATSTRQVDSLRPGHVVGRIQAIMLSGGSAYGLDSSGGALKYLEEMGRGTPTPYAVVPSVPTAVIFDLSIGDPKARPGPAMGYEACRAAARGRLESGSAGAGTGATVGKAGGIERAMKGGIGGASARLRSGTIAGVITVVNAFGDVLDASTGKIIAGMRDRKDGRALPGSLRFMRDGGNPADAHFQNTTISVVATDAKLSREEALWISQLAQDTYARSISPCHTRFDGDVTFAVSTGEKSEDLHHLGLVIQELVSRSIESAVREADGFGILPAWRDISGG